MFLFGATELFSPITLVIILYKSGFLLDLDLDVTVKLFEIILYKSSQFPQQMIDAWYLMDEICSYLMDGD